MTYAKPLSSQDNLTGPVTRRNAAGRLIARDWYRHGLRDGVSLRWDDAGRLVMLCEYVAGKRHGRRLAWWPNGQPRFECHYRHGEPWGEARHWFEDGTLQFVSCVPLVPDQTRVMVTSMLPRVALEYGHT
jgi:antitoxin component YwqK of YwqJK toxin-antitoxin module